MANVFLEGRIFALLGPEKKNQWEQCKGFFEIFFCRSRHILKGKSHM
jgi:hypothetical protein